MKPIQRRSLGCANALALLCLILIASAPDARSQSMKFSTASMPANITNIATPNAEVSAVLDTNNYTHIAWIDEANNVSKLKYTVYNNATFTTVEISVPGALTNELKIGPSIVLDKNQHPHIVYFVKRNRSGGTQTGNYAVMYAGDPEGDGSFEVSQVSTNAASPTDNTDNIFHAYVNGRPSILFDGDQVVVTYHNYPSSLTSFDKYIIFARKLGSSWTRTQEIDISKNKPPGIDDDVTLPQRLTTTSYMVWNDISTYNPIFAWKSGTSWTSKIIPGYDGALGTTKHCQLEVDNKNVAHFIWFSNKVKRFCHTTLSGSSYSAVEEDSTLTYYSNNFYPATVDLATGKPVYVYYENPNYNIISFSQTGQRGEQEITKQGVVYGKRSLNVRNGFISFVTASQGDQKIYVTTNTASTSDRRRAEPAPATFTLEQNYPNPFNPSTTIEYSVPNQEWVTLRILDILGRGITTLVRDKKDAGTYSVRFDATGLSSGVYFYRLQAGDFTQTRKLLLSK